MLKISKQVDYALQFLAALRQLKSGDYLSLKQFTTRAHLPFLFLQKIVRQLRWNGMVASVQGPRGGYRLTKPLSEVSLLEVIESVEGRYGMTACTRSKGCIQEGHCSIASKFKELNTAITRQLQAVSVENLVSISKKS